MGKRSNFERTPGDLYNTPATAVQPLLRWLRPHTRFIEPCHGNGDLARVLEAAGHHCLYSYGLPIDAREHDYGVSPGVIFITNPPFWGRPNDLHPLIENLSNQAQTWLLMPTDWLFNKSSFPLTRRLRRIVAVGRVKWVPGSRYTGQDNAAWLLFYRYGRRATFIGRSPIKRHEPPDALRTRANRFAALAGIADGRERARSDAGLSETSRRAEGVQDARSRREGHVREETSQSDSGR